LFDTLKGTQIMALENKVALVMGGGRGIGAATVRLLAAQGAKVIFTYVQNRATAEALAAEVGSKGGRATAQQVDAHDADQVRALVQRICDQDGRLDAVISSVPPHGMIKPFEYFTWDEFIQATTTELKTVFELSRAVLPVMRAQRSGHIVFVTSGWAKYPSMDGLTSLTPAFAAQVGFVRALARECGRDNITVNAIAPGMVDTDLSAQMPEQVRQQVAAITPLGRIAVPDDVARVISFFASDASGFITGTYVPVNGGLSPE
jgi:3-oxoacyl-[acyl-carrier protein] reductase